MYFVNHIIPSRDCIPRWRWRGNSGAPKSLSSIMDHRNSVILTPTTKYLNNIFVITQLRQLKWIRNHYYFWFYSAHWKSCQVARSPNVFINWAFVVMRSQLLVQAKYWCWNLFLKCYSQGVIIGIKNIYGCPSVRHHIF